MACALAFALPTARITLALSIDRALYPAIAVVSGADGKSRSFAKAGEPARTSGRTPGGAGPDESSHFNLGRCR